MSSGSFVSRQLTNVRCVKKKLPEEQVFHRYIYRQLELTEATTVELGAPDVAMALSQRRSLHMVNKTSLTPFKVKASRSASSDNKDGQRGSVVA